MLYENLEMLTSLGFIVVILILVLYFITSSRRTEEWERRILIVVLFFSIHELSFFLVDSLVYQLTNVLFVISLLYALLYIFSFEKRLYEMKEQRKELLKYLEEIRGMDEIKDKLGLK